jgi:hypothetical protein
MPQIFSLMRRILRGFNNAELGCCFIGAAIVVKHRLYLDFVVGLETILGELNALKTSSLAAFLMGADRRERGAFWLQG